MKKTNNSKCVFFDYDGVIVKPDDNIEAWIKACREMGFYINNNDWNELEGMKPNKIAKLLLTKYNVTKICSEQLVTEKNKKYKVLLNKKRNKAKIYKNIELILSYLKNHGVKIGLVTGATLARVNESIPKLKDFFNTMVTADSVDENKQKILGKPSSSPWLFAVKKLNFSIKQCTAIENSTLGIKSVKAAGLYCIALETTLKRELLKRAGADLVLKNHIALLNYFQNLYE